MKLVVLDIECKKDFYEVGGRQNFKDLGVSVAGAYDYETDSYRCFEEHELGELEDLIESRDGIIGFNIRNFDVPVLQPYFSKVNLEEKYMVDMLIHVAEALGFRVALNALASGTLGKSKSGHGRDAVPLYREGKIDELKKYCGDDVRITKELYEWGRDKGLLSFVSRTGETVTVAANWSQALEQHSKLQETLREAFSMERIVRIAYRSSGKDRELTERDIEIYAIRGSAIEAFCHLRKDRRRFMLDRIERAEVQEESNSQRALI